jgi:CBS-domain-containing membrane protein
VHTLPVLDENGQLIGVIGTSDIIRMIAEGK